LKIIHIRATIYTDSRSPVSIRQTASAKSKNNLKHADFKSVAPGILISELSFSHIIELAREDDLLKRTFYEVHAIQGSWSLKELRQQMSSLLYAGLYSLSISYQFSTI